MSASKHCLKLPKTVFTLWQCYFSIKMYTCTIIDHVDIYWNLVWHHRSWNATKDEEDSDEGGEDRSPCQLVKRDLWRIWWVKVLKTVLMHLFFKMKDNNGVTLFTSCCMDTASLYDDLVRHSDKLYTGKVKNKAPNNLHSQHENLPGNSRNQMLLFTMLASGFL